MQKDNCKRKKVWLFLIIVVYFAISYTVLNYFNITCVFLDFFGIPCPGCGMTRALISLVNLDFYQAIKHNVVIFFMPYIFMYVFFDFKHKIHNVILSLIGIVAIINWVIKIILFF